MTLFKNSEGTEAISGGYGAIVFEEITTGGQYEICGKPSGFH